MKGQAEILTEFLTFAIGIITVISITFIFSQQLAPTIIKEAMQYQLQSVLSHINVLAAQLTHFSASFPDRTQTLIIDMPKTIGQFSYQIYSLGDELCTSTPSSEYLQCTDNLYNVHGTFSSSTRMKLVFDGSAMTLSNQQ